jgi:hypothetical protein
MVCCSWWRRNHHKIACVLYLFPRRADDIWPWHLTPPTASMLGAIFALGIAGLGAMRQP